MNRITCDFCGKDNANSVDLGQFSWFQINGKNVYINLSIIEDCCTNCLKKIKEEIKSKWESPND